MFAPTDYDFGDKSNYEFATKITCANDEARKMFVEAFGHMLNYNHEQAIACFMACTESDPNCAMAWWGIAYCVSSNYNWAPGLGSGYDAFLYRYQQMLRIPPTDPDLSLENYGSSEEGDCHDTVTGTATDLEVEVRRLRHETVSQRQQISALQNHKDSQQKQITDQKQQITDQQQQITDQQRQIEQILLKFKDFEQNTINTKM